MNDRELAFEYVLGTLRGSERKQAEHRLKIDPEFARTVAYWEENMMALQPPELMPAPAQTWANIAARLESGQGTSEQVPRSWREVLMLRWALAVCMVLFVGMVSYTSFMRVDSMTPNASYAAILTNANGSAALTALTSKDGKRLWLQWDTIAISADQSVQLWAISKRDGEARSLAVFADASVTQLPLDEASARLIHDAAELVLTIEEVGGSAIDEPSEQWVARGVCVRLGKT